MKRMVLILAVWMMIAAPVCAQEELRWLSPTIGGNDAVMIVDNGDDWTTRLNLRAEQSKESEIKGRIYTGTRVEIYQDNGVWCTVGLNFTGGTVMTGEVMKRYLTPVGEDFSALCPLAVAKEETAVVNGIDMTIAQLRPGDEAYVLAACGKRYFLMVPGAGQGYAQADAFGELIETPEVKRIVYRSFYVPAGGITFMNEQTGDEVFLAGGVELKDCWKIVGDAQWQVTFGAGIQRTPRVEGMIPQEKLVRSSVPFEGEAYALGNSFVTCVGMVNGRPILRKVDQNGNVFWAEGSIPPEAVPIDRNICRLECSAEELLSQEAIKGILSYVRSHRPLDERTEGDGVTDDVLDRCTVCAALELNPGTGELIRIHAWIEDSDGSYVTGGDIDLKTGEITRWGCNA